MDANQQNIYHNPPLPLVESQAGQAQRQGPEQTEVPLQTAFANTAETQAGGLQELLDALRHALKDDSQTSAFKQFSRVQEQFSRVQEQARNHESPLPIGRPVLQVMPSVIRQPHYSAQSRPCTVI
ncbi:hypothetical protein QFC24_004193 [Naganishia onofrii]|uniref:Uncharacterized protein n=1 Tax=Naganishia onofrii TaxID=1851511 RepID=A0ACC2XGK3_9TREE|nr:hypothetical protein QFC24_004193 [Naganishia onofrii]